MPSGTPPRTVAQVDAALDVVRASRQRLQLSIAEHLAVVQRHREDFARSGKRIDELLEEREELTAPRCPDTAAGLDTEDAQ
jgi:urease gamma subunit